MYGTVAMTPDDDTLQFNNDEGNNMFLELLSSMFVMFLIFQGHSILMTTMICH